MTVRHLVTAGKNKFVETTYNRPSCKSNEITVRTIMTGICRSDIDMMNGNFDLLPDHMHGHEGLGQVIEVGENVNDVSVGDYVATRGEPGYADEYNVRSREYVKVTAPLPKNILEPVACGINVVTQPLREIAERSGPGRRLLLIGTGFLAWVAYHTLLLNHIDIDITVQGKSNDKMWRSAGVLLLSEPIGSFDVIIDLGGNDNVFTKDIVRNEALVIFGVQKSVTTDFGNLLWKACTMVFPSPRTDGFYKCMQDAAYWVENGNINVDNFWTKGYNRDTEWQQAFSDSLTRPAGYSRGYIYWNINGS